MRDKRNALIGKGKREQISDAPDRKKGEWESEYLEASESLRKKLICPFCRSEYADEYHGYIDVYSFNFCPNCGAELTFGRCRRLQRLRR